MTPKVSIIIPVFNKAKWIEATLQTVENQTFTDWECLIVDDGSTDSSLEVICAFIEGRGEKWKVHTQVNQGQCAARNLAIDKSSGKYIAFLDGDDTWSNNKLQVQTALLDFNESAVLVICPYVIFKANQKRHKQRIVDHGKAKNLIRNWINFRGFGGGTESTGLVRKSSLMQVGGFNPTLSTSAGADLSMRLARTGKVINARDCYMKYRIHTGQWHTNQEVLRRDAFTLYEGMSWVSPSKRKYLENCCNAYLNLQEIRQNPSLRTLRAVVRSPSDLSYLTILLVHIFLRNSKSRARANAPWLLTKLPSNYRKSAFLD